MKRIFCILLCACLLLGGCGPSTPPATEPSETAAQTQPTQPATQPDLRPLLEQGEAVAEEDGLLYIPNAHAESFSAPEVRLFGNGLILSEYVPQGDAGLLMLRRISLEDGTLLAEGSVPASGSVQLSIGSGYIILCDSVTGQVAVLDESFAVQERYSLSCGGDHWFVGPELDKLFVFHEDRGLVLVDLASGEENWIVENAVGVIPRGQANSSLIFEYTDLQDQRIYTRCLNLYSGVLETMPVSGRIDDGIRSGDTWLLHHADDLGDYSLIFRGEAFTFRRPNKNVKLLSNRNQLLLMDDGGRKLSLYDLDGSFISSCTLPEKAGASVGKDFVWSGYWEGYFFTDTVDGSCRLMFWDVQTQAQGDALELTPAQKPADVEYVMDSSLYDRAKALSEEFGLSISIGEDCFLEYSTYDAAVLTDPYAVTTALNVLETACGNYPEGFFRQLCHGFIEEIRIEVVGTLTLQEGVDTHPESVGAIVHQRYDTYVMVINGYDIRPELIYHEFSHIIDKRLEWDAYLRGEEALYSEETWLSLQPQGFAYAMSYVDISEQTRGFLESGYFLGEYSMTFPTEDRATLMEAAMQYPETEIVDYPGRIAKLQYYADCIRDCFDTEHWPQVTCWEQGLQP